MCVTPACEPSVRRYLSASHLLGREKKPESNRKSCAAVRAAAAPPRGTVVLDGLSSACLLNSNLLNSK